jgi:hypothetical protein
LRIFYGLNRFSEDLDFSLLKSDINFELKPYFKSIQTEFESLGLKIEIKKKLKSQDSHIESAFLKNNTEWNLLILNQQIEKNRFQMIPNLKIKIEVDKLPPGGFETEEKLLLRPFSFYTKCYQSSDLFAGKMHAVLFRQWKQNVKGRDWYDLEWYIKNKIPLNLNHLCLRAIDSGDWEEQSLNKNQLFDLLSKKISSLNIDQAKADIVRFIPNPQSLNIWSKSYFLDLIRHL